MSKALLNVNPASAASLSLYDCSPMFMGSTLSFLKKNWRPSDIDTAVMGCSASIVITKSSSIFVPYSLIESLTYFEKNGQLKRNTNEVWNTLVHDNKLVLCVNPNEVNKALLEHPQFKSLCLLLPAGPLLSKIDFKVKIKDLYSDDVPSLMQRLRGKDGNRDFRVWMRAALACPYEGTYVAPIPVAEHTARLFANDAGPFEILWEQSIPGLTPRWLETFYKTASSCGVPLPALAVGINGNDDYPMLVSKSIEAGIHAFCGCAIKHSVHSSIQPFVSIADFQSFVNGWNDSVFVHTDLRVEEGEIERAEEEETREFCSLLDQEWIKLLQY